MTPPANNHPPSLTAVAVATNEDVTTSAQLAATDPDNNPVTFALTGNPQHGTATLTAAGILTYTPAANYSGADTLGITVSDNAGAQSSGTIAVTVTAVDDAPALTTRQLSVNEDDSLSTQLAGTDLENDAFTFQLVPGTAHGNVTLTVSGALTYTPTADYAGADQVQVRLVENASGIASGAQIVNITVLPLNDPPAAHDDTLRVAATAGQAVALPVLTNDLDVDGDTLMPTVITQPQGGAVMVNPTTRQLMFEPTNDYLGPIEFTYRVNDGSADSNVATVRALIGGFQNLLFLSDYTKPGVTELHVFDGLEVRRLSDDLPPGSNIIFYSWSGDLTKVVYVVDGNDAMRVYVKPLDGSAVAALRYTSALKSPPAGRSVWAYLNTDGSFMTVTDQWSGPAKQIFMVNNATGVVTQIASLMPDLVDVRFAIFHPFEPNLVMVTGQTAGNVPRDGTLAETAFLGNASDMSTLTRIGRTYSPSDYGAGEGFYFGRDPRYIYYGEQVRIGTSYPINLLAYDRQIPGEFHVVRYAFPPDRGMNGTGWPSPDFSRMCYAFYEPTTTTIDGPSRFYTMDLGNPASATPVTPVMDRTSQCTFASDNRTMIYRVFTSDYVTQRAYAVDSSSPGVPRLLAPPGEAAAKQGMWMFAHDAMRGAIAYFDNNGVPTVQGQVGRNYLLPLDGNGDPFLFSDSFVRPDVTSFFYDLSDTGNFLVYARPNGVSSSLEIMSTHALNYSIPLSRSGETVGVRRATWLQRYP
ncbi:MAG: Ig-like domain-containing protein [Pseudomonadota bacterium]